MTDQFEHIPDRRYREGMTKKQYNELIDDICAEVAERNRANDNKRLSDHIEHVVYNGLPFLDVLEYNTEPYQSILNEHVDPAVHDSAVSVSTAGQRDHLQQKTESALISETVNQML